MSANAYTLNREFTLVDSDKGLCKSNTMMTAAELGLRLGGTQAWNWNQGTHGFTSQNIQGSGDNAMCAYACRAKRECMGFSWSYAATDEAPKECVFWKQNTCDADEMSVNADRWRFYKTYKFIRGDPPNGDAGECPSGYSFIKHPVEIVAALAERGKTLSNPEFQKPNSYSDHEYVTTTLSNTVDTLDWSSPGTYGSNLLYCRPDALPGATDTCQSAFDRDPTVCDVNLEVAGSTLGWEKTMTKRDASYSACELADLCVFDDCCTKSTSGAFSFNGVKSELKWKTTGYCDDDEGWNIADSADECFAMAVHEGVLTDPVPSSAVAGIPRNGSEMEAAGKSISYWNRVIGCNLATSNTNYGYVDDPSRTALDVTNKLAMYYLPTSESWPSSNSFGRNSRVGLCKKSYPTCNDMDDNFCSSKSKAFKSSGLDAQCSTPGCTEADCCGNPLPTTFTSRAELDEVMNACQSATCGKVTVGTSDDVSPNIANEYQQNHPGKFYQSLTFSPDGSKALLLQAKGAKVLAFDADGQYVETLSSRSCSADTNSFAHYTDHAVITPDGQFAYTWYGNKIKKWAITKSIGTSTNYGDLSGGHMTQSQPAISPDGKFMYIPDGNIKVMKIDENGDLTLVQKVQWTAAINYATVTGTDAEKVNSLVISPAGDFVYTLGDRANIDTPRADHQYVRWSRNAATGELTYVDSLLSEPDTYLYEKTMIMSPDGNYLYAYGVWGTNNVDRYHRIVTVKVDATGLSHVNSPFALGANNPARPASLKISPEGSYIIVNYGDHNGVLALKRIERNKKTGALKALSTDAEGINEVFEGRSVPRTVFHPSGKSYYSISYGNMYVTPMDVNNYKFENNKLACPWAGDKDFCNPTQWNVASVNDLSNLFAGMGDFPANVDLSSWNVQGKNIAGMFANTKGGLASLAGLDNWAVSGSLAGFLKGTKGFSDDITGWDTAAVTDLSSFAQNSDFNQDLDGWDTSNVKDFGKMFAATAYNQDLSMWSVASATNTVDAFEGKSCIGVEAIGGSHAPDTRANAVMVNEPFAPACASGFCTNDLYACDGATGAAPVTVCSTCPVPFDMKAVPVGTKVVCEDTSVACTGGWVQYGGGCYHPTCTDVSTCCGSTAWNAPIEKDIAHTLEVATGGCSETVGSNKVLDQSGNGASSNNRNTLVFATAGGRYASLIAEPSTHRAFVQDLQNAGYTRDAYESRWLPPGTFDRQQWFDSCKSFCSSYSECAGTKLFFRGGGTGGNQYRYVSGCEFFSVESNNIVGFRSSGRTGDTSEDSMYKTCNNDPIVPRDLSTRSKKTQIAAAIATQLGVDASQVSVGIISAKGTGVSISYAVANVPTVNEAATETLMKTSDNAGVLAILKTNGAPYANAVTSGGDPSDTKDHLNFKKCPPGEGVVTVGTATANTVCGACPAGKFSGVSSATEACKDQKSCGVGKGAKKSTFFVKDSGVCKRIITTQEDCNEASAEIGASARDSSTCKTLSSGKAVGSLGSPADTKPWYILSYDKMYAYGINKVWDYDFNTGALSNERSTTFEGEPVWAFHNYIWTWVKEDGNDYGDLKKYSIVTSNMAESVQVWARAFVFTNIQSDGHWYHFYQKYNEKDEIMQCQDGSACTKKDWTSTQSAQSYPRNRRNQVTAMVYDDKSEKILGWGLQDTSQSSYSLTGGIKFDAQKDFDDKKMSGYWTGRTATATSANSQTPVTKAVALTTKYPGHMLGLHDDKIVALSSYRDSYTVYKIDPGTTLSSIVASPDHSMVYALDKSNKKLLHYEVDYIYTHSAELDPDLKLKSETAYEGTIDDIRMDPLGKLIALKGDTAVAYPLAGMACSDGNCLCKATGATQCKIKSTRTIGGHSSDPLRGKYCMQTSGDWDTKRFDWYYQNPLHECSISTYKVGTNPVCSASSSTGNGAVYVDADYTASAAGLNSKLVFDGLVWRQSTEAEYEQKCAEKCHMTSVNWPRIFSGHSFLPDGPRMFNAFRLERDVSMKKYNCKCYYVSEAALKYHFDDSDGDTACVQEKGYSWYDYATDTASDTYNIGMFECQTITGPAASGSSSSDVGLCETCKEQTAVGEMLASPGTYNDEDGSSGCKVASTECPAGFEIGIPSTTIADAQCTACPAGKFKASAGADVCIERTKCPAGQGAVTYSTSLDTTCEACVSGTTYSNEDSNTQICKTIASPCDTANNYTEVVSPSASANRVCALIDQFGEIQSEEYEQKYNTKDIVSSADGKIAAILQTGLRNTFLATTSRNNGYNFKQYHQRTKSWPSTTAGGWAYMTYPFAFGDQVVPDNARFFRYSFSFLDNVRESSTSYTDDGYYAKVIVNNYDADGNYLGERGYVKPGNAAVSFDMTEDGNFIMVGGYKGSGKWGYSIYRYGEEYGQSEGHSNFKMVKDHTESSKNYRCTGIDVAIKNNKAFVPSGWTSNAVWAFGRTNFASLPTNAYNFASKPTSAIDTKIFVGTFADSSGSDVSTSKLLPDAIRVGASIDLKASGNKVTLATSYVGLDYKIGIAVQTNTLNSDGSIVLGNFAKQDSASSLDYQDNGPLKWDIPSNEQYFIMGQYDQYTSSDFGFYGYSLLEVSVSGDQSTVAFVCDPTGSTSHSRGVSTSVSAQQAHHYRPPPNCDGSVEVWSYDSASKAFSPKGNTAAKGGKYAMELSTDGNSVLGSTGGRTMKYTFDNADGWVPGSNEIVNDVYYDDGSAASVNMGTETQAATQMGNNLLVLYSNGDVTDKKTLTSYDLNAPCPTGQFVGANGCQPLTKCPPGQGAQPGTGTHRIDSVCEPCQTGVTYSDDTSSSICKPVSTCPAGTQLDRAARRSSDVTCKNFCPSTMYLDTATSKCLPLTECNAIQTVGTPATATTNRVCADTGSFAPSDTDAFRAKLRSCGGIFTPSGTTGVQRTGANWDSSLNRFKAPKPTVRYFKGMRYGMSNKAFEMWGNWNHDDPTCDINNWVVSLVTNMDGLFTLPYMPKNMDLSSWDTSSVTSMRSMFYLHTAIDRDKISYPADSNNEQPYRYPDKDEDARNGQAYEYMETLSGLASWDTSNVEDIKQIMYKWNRDTITVQADPLYTLNSRRDPSASDKSFMTIAEPKIVAFVESIGNNGKLKDISRAFMDTWLGHKALDLSTWDVSSVTDTYAMFKNFDHGTEVTGDLDVSGWDMSKVTRTLMMFHGLDTHNPDVTGWTCCASATSMSQMFDSAKKFDGDVSNWDVSQVTTMQNMFSGADAFNSDVSNWATHSVTTMSKMFYSADNFDQDVSNWDTRKVKNMYQTFYQTKMSYPISSWDTSSVTNCGSMFGAISGSCNSESATCADGVTSTSCASTATPMNKCTCANGVGSRGSACATDGAEDCLVCNAGFGFTTGRICRSCECLNGVGAVGDACPSQGASKCGSCDNHYKLDGDACAFSWKPSSNSVLDTAVADCIALNPDGSQCPAQYGPIGSWDVSGLWDFRDVFKDKTQFNQDLSTWDVSSGIYFQNMFRNADAFDQDLSAWNMPVAREFDYMFNGADAYNNGGQPLTWSLPASLDFQYMFQYTKAFNQDVSSLVGPKTRTVTYMFDDAAAFDNGGQPIIWSPTSITSMNRMFKGAKSFNQDVSGIDTSKVIDMRYMFYKADVYDNGGQPLTFDTGSVTTMQYMFQEAKKFNQSVSTLDTRKITNMQSMFKGATAFNQDTGNWKFPAITSLSPLTTMFENSGNTYDLERWMTDNAFSNSGFQYSTAEIGYGSPCGLYISGGVAYSNTDAACVPSTAPVVKFCQCATGPGATGNDCPEDNAYLCKADLAASGGAASGGAASGGAAAAVTINQADHEAVAVNKIVQSAKSDKQVLTQQEETDFKAQKLSAAAEVRKAFNARRTELGDRIRAMKDLARQAMTQRMAAFANVQKTRTQRRKLVKESIVEITKDDLTQTRRTRMCRGPLCKPRVATGLDNKNEADTCAQGADSDNCCSYDVSDDDAGTVTILTPFGQDGWTVFCDNNTILSKQTMTRKTSKYAESRYTMQCWDATTNSWGAEVTGLTPESTDYQCNNRWVVIGSQSMFDCTGSQYYDNVTSGNRRRLAALPKRPALPKRRRRLQTTYKEFNYATTCGDEAGYDYIDTETECQTAFAALGISMAMGTAVVSGTGQPRGCHYVVGLPVMYLNTDTSSTTGAQADVMRIVCKSSGAAAYAPLLGYLSNQTNLVDTVYLRSNGRLAESPDGRHVYATNYVTKSVTVFERDASTGALIDHGSSARFVDQTNLDGALAVVVSPDGNNVYVAAGESDSVVIFDRDQGSGLLSNQVNIVDSTNLDGINDIDISPDGKNVYVAAVVKGVSYWTRDTSTGALSNRVTIEDATNLGAAHSIIVTPDGKFVYASAMTSRKIVYWERDLTTGALSNQQQLDLGMSNGFFVQGLAVSPDGTSLYVASSGVDKLVYFDRDTTTGALSNQVVIGPDSTNLDSITEVAVSPDGKYVYATCKNSDSIVHWERDSTGALSNQTNLIDSTNLDMPRGLLVSSDNKNVYVSAVNTIVSWDRGAAVALSAAASGNGVFIYVSGGDLNDPFYNFYYNENCLAGHIHKNADGTYHLEDNTTYTFRRCDGATSHPFDVHAEGGTGAQTGITGSKYLDVAFGNDGDRYTWKCTSHSSMTGTFKAVTSVITGDIGYLSNLAIVADETNLDGAFGVAVSTDGKNVYAVASTSKSIVHFDRNETTGALSNQVNLIDNDLNGVQSVVVSPDDKNVYTAAFTADKLVYFTRDASTGALSNKQVVDDATNLDGINKVVVSPDGSNVYAVAQGSKSIVYWDRDTSTGALSNQVNFIDAPTLAGVKSVVVSPDGKNIYAVTQGGNSTVYWDRDTSTGALSNMVNIVDHVNLEFATDVAISADGKNVYVVSQVSRALVYWDRDTTTGALSNQINLKNPEEFGGGRSVAVSADGESVYATTKTASMLDFVVRFDRDTSTGALSNQVNLQHTNINNPQDIVVSGDNKNVYLASQGGDSIVKFDREYSTAAAATNTAASQCVELTVCGTGEYESVAATMTSDRTCTPYTSCAAGKGVSVVGGVTTDYQCEDCAAGTTFSAVDGFDACQAVTACAAPMIEDAAPTASSDRTCAMPAGASCGAGEYESGAGCANLTVCADFEYDKNDVATDGSSTQDRDCAMKSTCPRGQGVKAAAAAAAGPVSKGAFGTQLGADIDGEAAGDYFGAAVSLSADGNTMAIGANSNDGNGDNAGHVRVYSWGGSAWTQLGADIDGKAAGDRTAQAGVSLSADGNTLAFGAPYGSSSGLVRVYSWGGSAWTQLGADIDGEAAGDRAFYASLSADGNTLAIGADTNDGNGDNAGHVRVYSWDGSAWTQLGTDLDGKTAGDRSGYAVSLSADGTTVAFGGRLNGAGHMRVFSTGIGSGSRRRLSHAKIAHMERLNRMRRLADTECEACVAGTSFSNTDSLEACQTVNATCVAPLVEKVAPTAESNRWCCAADEYACEATGTCETYTACTADEFESVAPTGKFDRTCLTHSACPIGKGVLTNGTATADTVCESCVEGSTYSSVADDIHSCVAVSQCAIGEGVSQNATTSSDVVCSPCAAGTVKDAVGNTACQAASTCPVGEGVQAVATTSVDTVCAACDGVTTFSASDSADACQDVTVCGAGFQKHQPPGVYNENTASPVALCGTDWSNLQSLKHSFNEIPAGFTDIFGNQGAGSGHIASLDDEATAIANAKVVADSIGAVTFIWRDKGAQYPETYGANGRSFKWFTAGNCDTTHTSTSAAAPYFHRYDLASGGSSGGPTASSDVACDACAADTFKPAAGNTATCQAHSAACGTGFVEIQAATTTQDRTCCADTEYHNGTHCNAHTAACGAGQIEIQAASSSQDRICCADGEYHDGTQCAALTACQAWEYISVNETTTSDRACADRSTCPIGQGFVSAGNAYSDTECEACVGDTYSDLANFDACDTHTDCSATGKLVDEEGTASADTVCVDSASSCASDQYKTRDANATHNAKCSNCTVCAAGEYATSACSASADTVCDACAAETFKATAGNEACTAVSTCSGGQVTDSVATATSNTTCKAPTVCGADEYESVALAAPATDRQCSACSSCPVGQGVSTLCTAAADTVCEPCNSNNVATGGSDQTGTFSSVADKLSECEFWSSCTTGHSVVQQPSATQNRGCEFRPSTYSALKAAVDQCLAADATGATGCALSGNSDMVTWNLVDYVGNMDELFKDASQFNAAISSWDVSGVTSMKRMFHGAAAFDQDISAWDVSGVENMESMFESASSFNQDVVGDANFGWNVGNVVNMKRMFYGATAYAQTMECGQWDTARDSEDIDTESMFVGTSSAAFAELAGYTATVDMAIISDNIRLMKNKGNDRRYYQILKQPLMQKHVPHKLEGCEAHHVGSTVATSANGRVMAVGGYETDNNGCWQRDDIGAVFVYRLESDDIWRKMGKLVPGAECDNQFGYSLDISEDGKFIAVGSPYCDANATGAAHLFVFDGEMDSLTDAHRTADSPVLDTSTATRPNRWTRYANHQVGAAAGDQFGYAVSVANSNSGRQLKSGSLAGEDLKAYWAASAPAAENTEKSYFMVRGYPESVANDNKKLHKRFFDDSDATLVGGQSLALKAPADGFHLVSTMWEDKSSVGGKSGFKAIAYKLADSDTTDDFDVSVVGTATDGRINWPLGSSEAPDASSMDPVKKMGLIDLSVDMSADGQTIAIGYGGKEASEYTSGNADGAVKVFQLDSDTFVAKGDAITGEFPLGGKDRLSLSGDGNMIMVGSGRFRPMYAETDAAKAFGFASNNADWRASIKVYQYSKGDWVGSFDEIFHPTDTVGTCDATCDSACKAGDLCKSEIKSAHLSSDGSHLIVAYDTNEVFVYRFHSKTGHECPYLPSQIIQSVCYTGTAVTAQTMNSAAMQADILQQLKNALPHATKITVGTFMNVPAEMCAGQRRRLISGIDNEDVTKALVHKRRLVEYAVTDAEQPTVIEGPLTSEDESTADATVTAQAASAGASTWISNTQGDFTNAQASECINNPYASNDCCEILRNVHDNSHCCGRNSDSCSTILDSYEIACAWCCS